MAYTSLPPIDLSYVRELTPEARAMRQYSTLDLIGPDRFTILGDLDVHGLPCYKPGVDFYPQGEGGNIWMTKSGVSQGVSLLVRPDQHILAVLDPTTTSERVFAIINQHLRQE